MDSGYLVPKISAKFKRVHPKRRCQMQVGRLNAGAVAENCDFRREASSNLVRSQVYHTERASTLFVCSTFAVMQRVAQVCRRQLIVVTWNHGLRVAPGSHSS